MQPQSEEFRAQAAECEELAKRHGGLVKQQYEQLAGQWSFLAEQAETFNRRSARQWPLIIRDAVFLCAAPRSYF
jgi:hypothetical protein